MNIARVFTNLRPNATYKGNRVNFYSLETIAKTFEGVMITPEEAEIEWNRIRANNFIDDYRKEKKQELIAFIKDNQFETVKTTEEIKTKWNTFKNNLSSLDTKEEVDSAVQSAISWLGI